MRDPSDLPGFDSPVRRHLEALAAFGERPTGSMANRQVEAYLEEALAAAGCRVERLAFPCVDWRGDRAICRCGVHDLLVVANPYSPSCEVETEVIAASTDAELTTLDDAPGKIVVLHGTLSTTPWMPAEFPFYADEEAQARVRLLREMGPAAVVTVSPREDYPVPVIIDGSLCIPSCTVGPVAGSRLLASGAGPVRLTLETETRPAEASDVIGRLGGDGPCIVLSAHLDTKHYTPGALDNATGTAVLLALSARLVVDPPCPLEFVLFNGEEHYAAPGEVAYIEAGRLDPARVRLAINLDGIGLLGYPASIALFGSSPALEAAVHAILADHPDLVEVDPWPAGDHMVFWMRGVPSMAISSAAPPEALDLVLHTPTDTPDKVDAALVARTADAIEDLVRAVARSLGLSAALSP